MSAVASCRVNRVSARSVLTISSTGVRAAEPVVGPRRRALGPSRMNRQSFPQKRRGHSVRSQRSCTRDGRPSHERESPFPKGRSAPLRGDEVLSRCERAVLLDRGWVSLQGKDALSLVTEGSPVGKGRLPRSRSEALSRRDRPSPRETRPFGLEARSPGDEDGREATGETSREGMSRYTRAATEARA